MATTIIIHHLVAVLKMPSKWADKIVRIQFIQGKLVGNGNFPTGSWPANVVTLAQFGLDITAFINAHNAVKAAQAGFGDRNTAFTIVKNDLEALMTMVQLKANSNSAGASGIITGAGYFVRLISSRQKQINDALNTQISGTILLTSDTAGHHEWEISKDMVAIIKLDATSTSHTTVPNLTPGDVYWCRNRKLTKKTTYNWSPWLEYR